MPLITNRNFFNPIQAEFHLRRLPNVNFLCQKVVIPGMSTMALAQPTPFSTIREPGDHIEFDEMSVTFKVDEYLTNYLEVVEWITRIGFPESFEQYRRLDTSLWTGEGRTSDGTIVFLDSKANPKMECSVQDMFPISISGITVDTTLEGVDYVTATATFAYTLYKFSRMVTSDA